MNKKLFIVSIVDIVWSILIGLALFTILLTMSSIEKKVDCLLLEGKILFQEEITECGLLGVELISE